MVGMPLSRIALIAALFAARPLAAQLVPVNVQPIRLPYAESADRLIAAALSDSTRAWNLIAEFTDTFGPRLSGSPALEHGIDWIVRRMRADGLENVTTQPVKVPHWVRGDESLDLVSPRAKHMALLGLGGSIATPLKGITAPVLVVSSFDELTRRAAEAKDKIVLFDVPFRTDIEPFAGYSEAVRYRA